MVLNLPDLRATLYTVPHVVVTPRHEVLPLLLHHCSLATVMNRNVEICVFRWSEKGSVDLQRGRDLLVLNQQGQCTYSSGALACTGSARDGVLETAGVMDT